MKAPKNSKYSYNILLNFKKKTNETFISNYCSKKTDHFQIILINNILANNRCHIVSLFKDLLLYDEESEFLKRYYTYPEIKYRLKKILFYFKQTSFLFPNYTPIPEAKYIYSNIIKKQIVIDKQENMKKNIGKKQKIIKNISYDDYKNNIRKRPDSINFVNRKFFDSTIYNEILDSGESCMSLIFGAETKVENQKDFEEINKLIYNIQTAEDKVYCIKKNNEAEIKKDKIRFINGLNSRKNYSYNNSLYNSSELNFKRNNNSKILNIKGCNLIQNTKQNDSDFSKSFYCKSNCTNNSTLASVTNSANINKNNQTLLKKNNGVIMSCRLKEINKEIINKNNNTGNNEIKNINVYHRKVNSISIGGYLNKIELLSNSSVVKALKYANINANANNISNMRDKMFPKFKRNNYNLLYNYKKIYIKKDKNENYDKGSILSKDQNINKNMLTELKNYIAPHMVNNNLAHSQTEKIFNTKLKQKNNNNTSHNKNIKLLSERNTNKKKFVYNKNSPLSNRNNVLSSRIVDNAYISNYFSIISGKGEICNYNSESNGRLIVVNSSIYIKRANNKDKLKILNSDKKPINSKFENEFFPINFNRPYNKPKAINKGISKNKCCFSLQKN